MTKDQKPKPVVVTRKVFEDFSTAAGFKLWSTARAVSVALDHPGAASDESWLRFRVAGPPCRNTDEEHLRQWLLAHGAEEVDEYVILSI